MPLCTLEIPRQQYAVMSAESKNQTAPDLCNTALDLTLQKLSIPNPKDREVRIVASPTLTRSKISVSFTVGLHEYSDFEPEAFFPTRGQIRSAGAHIQSNVGASLFQVAETRMEAWRDTTFVIRSPDVSEPIPPKLSEPLEKIGRRIEQPRVCLALSPNMVSGTSFSKELEPPRESEPYKGIVREISALIVETFGLPEQTQVQTEVLSACYADSDISVEFDCQPEEGYLIPEELREYAAKRIERCLNQNQLTKAGEAGIWIRQGKPQTEIITPED